MKKLSLFIAFIAISFGSIAQTLSLSYPGGVIPNGGSVVFETPGHVPILPGQRVIFVHNIGASDILVHCRKEVLDSIVGSVNSFCWDVCFGSEVQVSQMPLLITAGDSTDESGFSGDYHPHGNFGDTHVKYTFEEENNRDNNVSVIVTYRGLDDTYVNNFKQNDSKISISPNPASNMVNLNFSSQNANQKVEIKNMLGATIFTSDLSSSNNGKYTINTAEFLDGIYFVTLTSNGIPIHSKKLIIKH